MLRSTGVIREMERIDSTVASQKQKSHIVDGVEPLQLVRSQTSSTRASVRLSIPTTLCSMYEPVSSLAETMCFFWELLL